MENIKQKKQEIRTQMQERLTTLPLAEIQEKYTQIESQLFDFANFREAEVTLLYVNQASEMDSRNILRRCRQATKNIVLPLFRPDNGGPKLYKVANIEKDLKPGPNSVLEPDPGRCKPISWDDIDIAVIPGIAFDEKGGRLGIGSGRYDRLMTRLPLTARRVSCALEEQITTQVPMEPHDKYVDIIITEKRIIYKI